LNYLILSTNGLFYNLLYITIHKEKKVVIINNQKLTGFLSKKTT